MAPSILDLLDACQAAYDGAQIVAGPDGRDGASLTVRPDGELVLAFRGTVVAPTRESMRDWWNDFHAEMVGAPNVVGKVHAGFRESLGNLWPRAFAALQAADPKVPLTVTGHSKGGAVAVLAGALLASGARKPRVVAFAAPMAGDLTFDLNYPKIGVTRYEGFGDLVPFLPPVAYSAVGQRVGQNGKTRWDCRLLAWEHVAEGRWVEVVKAHELKTYRRWIEQLPQAPKAA